MLEAVESQYVRDAPDGGFAFSFADAIARALDAAAKRFGGLDAWAVRIAEQFARRVDGQVSDTIGSSIRSAFGIDASPLLQMQDVRGRVQMASAANVRLIRSVRDQYFDRINALVTQGVMQGKRSAALAEEIQHLTGVTASRAKLIARDQTSKLTSAFTEARQTALGIDEYTWQTSGDERVRPDHAALDGRVFKWTSPPPGIGHPGQDINCRCVAIPYIRI